MRRIANTSELRGELERLLDYAQSYQPSRVRLASALRELSARVAGYRFAMEHDSPEALNKYLQEHPNADKSKHTVAKPEADKKEDTAEEDDKPWEKPDFDISWFDNPANAKKFDDYKDKERAKGRKKWLEELGEETKKKRKEEDERKSQRNREELEAYRAKPRRE